MLWSLFALVVLALAVPAHAGIESCTADTPWVTRCTVFGSSPFRRDTGTISVSPGDYQVSMTTLAAPGAVTVPASTIAAVCVLPPCPFCPCTVQQGCPCQTAASDSTLIAPVSTARPYQTVVVQFSTTMPSGQIRYDVGNGARAELVITNLREEPATGRLISVDKKALAANAEWLQEKAGLVGWASGLGCATGPTVPSRVICGSTMGLLVWRMNAAAAKMSKQARIDPLDADYHHVYQAPAAIPEQVSTGDAQADAAIIATALTLDRIMLMSDGMVISQNRLNSAGLAGDTAAATMQANAFNQYEAGLLAQFAALADPMARVRDRLIAAGAKPVLGTAASFARTQMDTYQHGILNESRMLAVLSPADIQEQRAAQAWADAVAVWPHQFLTAEDAAFLGAPAPPDPPATLGVTLKPVTVYTYQGSGWVQVGARWRTTLTLTMGDAGPWFWKPAFGPFRLYVCGQPALANGTPDGACSYVTIPGGQLNPGDHVSAVLEIASPPTGGRRDTTLMDMGPVLYAIQPEVIQ